MNKRQLGVTLILMLLMGVLLVGERVFNNNIKRVALTNNNIGELCSYSALEGTINYRLPDSWDVEEKKYPGNYIIYDNSFISKDMGILGYIQIISTTKSIDTIIEDDKGRIKANNAENYERTIEKINNKDINKVIYKEKANRGVVYINTIYYKQLSNDRVLKVLFSSSEDKYRENFKTIYEVILDSFDD